MACRADEAGRPAPDAQGPPLPLWEIGAGAAYFSLPQYIGSDQRTRSGLPIPYFVYRGESLQISRDAMSGRFFIRADLVLDLSGDFSLPVDSSENDAREGMPDIDFLFEVGPSLRYIFVRNSSNRRTLSIELPLRAVLQTDLRRISHEGWRTNPRLRYQEYFGPWRFSFWGGAYWNDRRYNNLLYGVDSEFATGERPAYSASGGYGGWAASAGLSYRKGAWWVGSFLRLYDINQSSFASSPLVIKQANVSFGLAAAWIFKTSTREVSRWSDG